MISSVPPAESETLAARLDRFFSLFQPTIGLAKDPITEKANPQEVVLLLYGPSLSRAVAIYDVIQ
jgi:hypothetical protein